MLATTIFCGYPWLCVLDCIITYPLIYHLVHNISSSTYRSLKLLQQYWWINGYIYVSIPYISIDIIDYWLVVSISLKNMLVSWDDDIPNIWKAIKVMFQTTNQYIYIYPIHIHRLYFYIPSMGFLLMSPWFLQPLLGRQRRHLHVGGWSCLCRCLRWSEMWRDVTLRC